MYYKKKNDSYILFSEGTFTGLSQGLDQNELPWNKRISYKSYDIITFDIKAKISFKLLSG